MPGTAKTQKKQQNNEMFCIIAKSQGAFQPKQLLELIALCINEKPSSIYITN
jgi:hypothetical protein